MTSFAAVSSAIQPRHFFGSPVLYALLALSCFVGLPLFALLRGWLGLRLERYLLCGAVLTLPAFGLLWMKWGGSPPLHFRALLWVIGHPMVGAAGFWVALRLLADEEERP